MAQSNSNQRTLLCSLILSLFCATTVTANTVTVFGSAPIVPVTTTTLLPVEYVTLPTLYLPTLVNTVTATVTPLPPVPKLWCPLRCNVFNGYCNCPTHIHYDNDDLLATLALFGHHPAPK